MVNTLNNSISTNVNLDGAGSNYQSPFTITANGTIVTSGFAVSDTTDSATLLNQGLIDSTHGVGVFLNQSGEVDNSSGATISAYFAAVDFIASSVGTVINDGTIVSTNREGVYLGTAGGTVTNTGAASLIKGASYGVQAEGFSTLVNAGQITGGQNGVDFYAGGSVSNSGTISGENGVWSYTHGAATVSNTGSITGSTSFGVYIAAGGAVTNSGSGALISGYNALGIKGGSGTVHNTGTITGQKSGVVLQSGGYVSNASTGTISTASGIAVGALGTVSTVNNAGTIASQGSGFGNYGISLGAGGTITNGGAGSISGYEAIRTDAGLARVNNFGGTITGGYAAILLNAGGYVENGGLITGENGIVIATAAGRVYNGGSIEATSGAGIQFNAGGYLDNSPGASITGSGDRAAISGAAGTIHNNCFITGSTNDGVYLAAGGTIFNDSGLVGYIISGGEAGVHARGAAATLHNYGTVTSGDIGADFGAGGYIENSRGTSVIAGSIAGVRVQGATQATVMNNGTITGTSVGVESDSGGYVANVRPYAVISGYTGVYTGGTNPSSVLNEGTISGDTTNGPQTTGVYLGKGGSVTNFGTAALITAYKAIVDRTGTGYVQNQFGGTITGSGIAIELFAGGTVNNNGSAGLISGGNAGIEIFAAAGSVSNFSGTITAASNGDAIVMQAGGNVYNSGLIGAGFDAVYTNGQPGYVTNTGNITAAVQGVVLRDGGTVSNLGTGTISGSYGGVVLDAAGTVYNTGSITGGMEHAVALYAGGTITNYGSTAVMSGAIGGIDVRGGAGTVLNQGLVQSTASFANTVDLEDGGTVTNDGTAALISGYNGVNISGAAGSVINSGSITGGTGSDAYGIRFYQGGYVLNSNTAASISGGRYGIETRGTGTVTNDGTIASAAGRGVYLMGGGTVTNTGTAALISGQAGGVLLGGAGLVDNAGTIAGPIAVSLYGSGTVINSGTISGSNYAVRLAGGYSLLVDDAGSVIDGRIIAFGGNNTLELGSGAGSLSGIGGTVTGFSTIAFDAGAAWTLSGNTTGLVNSGVSITGFSSKDEIELTDFAATSASYIAGSGLVLSNATASETIALTPKQPGASFAVTSDGTDTDLTELGVHTLTANYSGQLTISASGAYLDAFTIAYGVSVISGQGTAVYSDVPGASLTNYGSISYQPGGTNPGLGAGVELAGGGTVQNLGAAVIQGNYGVKIDGAAGSVYNQGVIAGIPTGLNGYVIGVDLTQGGTVTNYGVNAEILGGQAGIAARYGALTVINYGEIIAPAGIGVIANEGGYIGNSGLIGGQNTGIVIGNNGTVVNQAYIGGGTGIEAGSGSINNAGYIHGIYTGVSVRLYNDGGESATITNSGTILANNTYGYGEGIGIFSDPTSLTALGTVLPGAVYNAGLISGGTTYGYGVQMSGGYVSNSGTAATITGGNNGIAFGSLNFFPQGAGTVQNSGGTIIGIHNAGVTMNAGGYVHNALGGVITGGNAGVSITAYYSMATAYTPSTTYGGVYTASSFTYTTFQTQGSVVNDGTITGGSIGVEIAGGTLGAVAIKLGGSISSGGAGVALLSAYNTLANAGVIAGTSTLSYGAVVSGDASISNSGQITGSALGVQGFTGNTINISNTGGSISGGYAGIFLGANFNSVTNTGIITGTLATGSDGVALMGSGFVNNNGAAAAITGSNAGVQVGNGYGVVENAYGTIAGSIGDGVTLGSGGYIGNYGAGALISGGSLGADIHGNGLGNVTNTYGSITGGVAGVRIQGGFAASVNNVSGTVTGGSTGIYLADKNNNVYNSGVIGDMGSSTIENFGILLGGIYIPPAILATAPPGFFASTPLTFNDTQYGGTSALSNTSTGTITGSAVGIGLAASGNASILNQGVISGGTYGIEQISGFTGANPYYGAIFNTGTISGGKDGVFLNSRYNLVLNGGTISGGTDAVYMSGAFKTLIIDQDAVFNGNVVASAGGYSRLILSSDFTLGSSTPLIPGTITGIGSQFTGFENINIYTGDTWLVSGNSAGLASGQFINGFLSGNEIDLTNVQADSESFANNVLTLFEGGSIAAELNIYAENATSGSFAITNDSGTGTDITRLPSDPHTLSASIGYGITLSPGGRYNSPYTVTNAGTINAGGTGIYSAYNASVTVDGTVTGYQAGIMLTAGGTVVTAGEISGDTNAVQISGGAADVVVETGASFTGAVTAAAGYDNVLDVETTTLGGIGTEFRGFTTIDLGTTANSIAGTSAALAAGETVNGFMGGDTIDVTDLNFDSVSISNGTLTLLNGGNHAGSLVVSGAGSYSTDFAVLNDGVSGTDIVSLITRTISTTINTGVTLAPNLTYSNDLVITNTGAVLYDGGTNRAVYQNGPGHIRVDNGATVQGWIGIYQKDGVGATITNAGLLDGQDFGIALHTGGTVFNTGTIHGGQYGIAAYQTGVIDNQGLITGNVAGIYIGGDFVNVTTIENGGTIIGTSGVAIIINHSPADVIVDAGAVFDGTVNADGAAADMLELSSSATTGTISGIGTSFTGFSTIEIDNGASWVISGNSAGLASGQTIIGNGTIDLTDIKADSESFSSGVLSLYESGLLVGTLNVTTPRPANSSDFTVYTDGANGTEIVLDQPSPYVINTSLSTGVTLTPAGAYRSPLTITNTGAVNTSAYYGIFSSGAATIFNDGYVSATHGRYVLALNGAGNSVTNEAGGTIVGRIHLGGTGANTLINAGSINAFGLIGGSSAYLHNEAGGIISSSSQSQIGFVASNASIVNAGTIAETGNGLALNAGGTVTNLAGGTITGNSAGISLAHGLVSNAGYIRGGTGIYANGLTTVQNAGTIAGTSGTAINFGSANADLIAAPGAVFLGNVIANASHSNTLELTSGTTAGTLTGLNSQFTNFQTIIDDNNAAWTLSGVNAINTIDITNFTTTDGIVTIGATDELTIGNLTLSFASGDTGGLLTLSSDGHGGTEITNVLCFLEGTHIATPTGETQVENLAIGDLILTATGETVPVRWIGIHTAATRFADPLRIMPIRIHQGALGNNLPRRDLLLSPDHAMYINGVLIQAGALVNGINITRERHVPERLHLLPCGNHSATTPSVSRRCRHRNLRRQRGPHGLRQLGRTRSPLWPRTHNRRNALPPRQIRPPNPPAPAPAPGVAAGRHGTLGLGARTGGYKRGRGSAADPLGALRPQTPAA